MTRLTRRGPDALSWLVRPARLCPANKWLNTRLGKVLHAFRQIDPGMFGLFPHRQGRQWKIRVRKRTNGNAIMVGSEIEVPVNRTAASGTKVKADHPRHSFNVPRIDFFRTFHTDLRFVEVYARVHDRAGPSLAGLAVANIYDSRFSANRRA